MLTDILYTWVGYFVIQIYQPLDSTVLSWLYVGRNNSAVADFFKSGGFCEKTFNALTMFAGVLLLIYLFTSLTDKIMKELASTQVAIKALMELLVASLILLHGYPLVSGFACIGDNVIDFIQQGDSSVSIDTMQAAAKQYYVVITYDDTTDNNGVTHRTYKLYDSIYLKKNVTKIGNSTNINGGNVLLPKLSNYNNSSKWKTYLEDHQWDYAGNLFILLLLNVFSLVINVAAIAAAVGRLIQLIIYVCLSPIAIVNVFGEGMHSQGIRFFKKIFACSLQGPAMAVVIYLASVMSINGSGVLTYMAVQVAALMALFKASSFANDLVL